METASNDRQRQRSATRERILGAAVTCFASAGFDATSLAQVASAAGVKKALVQYHFTTKEQLWQAAATHLWQQRNERLAAFMEVRAGAAVAELMRPAFTALVEFTREHPQWLWFMFHEAQGDSPRRAWLIRHFLQDDYELGEQFVRRCQDEGLIRPAPPLQLLHLISGALTYNLLVAPQTLEATGKDLASRDSITEQVDLLLAMISA